MCLPTSHTTTKVTSNLINRNNDLKVVMGSLKCLGLALAENKDEVKLAISLEILPELLRLLNANEPIVRKQAAWVISNITAETEEEIKSVLSTGVMAKIIFLAGKDKYEIRKECIWTISNATANSNIEQIKELVSLGALEVLCLFITSNDIRTLSIALDGIINLLSRAKKELGEEVMNELALKVENCGGLDKIVEFQTHPNTIIYEKAVHIIETFFEVEDTDTTEPTKPTSIFDF